MKLPASGRHTHLSIVVAIPVRNEEACIAACLEALDNQSAGRADGIILLLNNCSDRTAAIVGQLRPSLATSLHVIEVCLPPGQANAGFARHLAVEAAARLTGEVGVLLTTDADSRVDPDWIGANLAAIEAGADAVAGWAELDPVDWGSIPLSLHQDDARECAYDAVCDEIHALLDPDPADPLPRHTQASGASIAVTTRAYRAAGGIPRVPLGEDRAFIAALRRIDAKIRHAPDCRVLVSGRVQGRAVGGMADTIRRRLMAADRFLDERLEPARDCAIRASLRQLARRVYDGSTRDCTAWQHLGVTAVILSALMSQATTFGAFWAAMEEMSPRLMRRLVPTSELSAQQKIAEAIRFFARRDPVGCNTLLRESDNVFREQA